MKFRPMLFLVSLLLSLALHLQRQYHGLPVYHGIALYFELVWNATLLPFAWQWRLLNTYIFGLDPDSGRYTFFVLLFSLTFWFFPVGRVERWFGTFDPFRDSSRPRPRILRAAVSLFEQTNKRLFGRQKTGGWAGIISMGAAAFRKKDFFAGRISLFGRFGTLWPCGVEPDGQAVTIGMPGSGKSTAAAIPAVLLHDGPVLCFDPKGEIAQRCYAARGAGGNGVRGRGDATFIVDPANLTKLPRSRFNPLYEIEQEPDPDNAARMVFNLAEGIVKNPGGENSWVYTGARDVAIGLIGYVLATYPPARRNLATVRRLLQEGDKASYAADVAAKVPGIEKLTPFDVLLRRMQALPPGPFRDSVAGQAANLEKMGDRQRGNILSALADATIWLDLTQFQDATASSDFLLRDFQTKRISVFVCLPLNELTGIAGGFMRMFLVMFTDMMYRAPAPPKAGTVLCLVDEFPQFGYIDRFCAIGPTMRSYGVKLWVLLQDLGQLKAIYPKEWESFIGCAAMVQYMAVQHGETVDYLVKALGEREMRVRDPATGRVVKIKYPLLDREQVPRFLAARDGNQIVVRYNRRPLRLKTAPYFWYLPFWMYAPDPLYPEPFLRAWARRRAVRKTEEAAKAEKQGTAGKGVRHAARATGWLDRRAAR